MRSFVILLLLALVGCRETNVAAPPVASAPPSAGADAALDAGESQSAAEIVRDYMRYLRREQGAKAVRLYWDCEAFAKRVYGRDFEGLSAEDQAATVSEHERFMMSIYALPNAAATMKHIQVQNVKVSQESGATNVTFDAHVGDPARSQPVMWVLQRRNERLRIVDMSNADGQALLTDLLRPAYKSTGLNPLEYVRSMTKEIPAIEDLMGNQSQTSG